MANGGSVPVYDRSVGLRQTIDCAPAQIHTGRPAARGFAGLEVESVHPSCGERGL
jgi:hypothetical protein